jgi:hypothetical protein
MAAMQTLPFPGIATEQQVAPRLSEILAESAALLEASKDSDDVEVREASIELAVRSLRAASMALHEEPAPRSRARRPLGKILQGPWVTETSGQ